jgi:replication factor A1
MTTYGFSYPACPACKKKLMAADGGYGWRCERCAKTFPECNETYNFSVQVGDFTTSVYAQVMGETVGDQIMGMPASELK